MTTVHQRQDAIPRIDILDGGTIQCEGSWTIPYMMSLTKELEAVKWPGLEELEWDAMNIQAMDTGGALVLYRTLDSLRSKGQRVELKGLRPEFDELMALVARHWASHRPSSRVKPISLVSGYQWMSRHVTSLMTALEFVGETTVHIGRSLRRPALIRWQMLFRSLELDGIHAMPITGLLAFLMGVVIAYQGAEQLRQFGANIFVVDLVGISFLREIGPLIVAILIAGRSGSAYAAQIGTMKVTEELDAIRTLGLSPIQLLVLPRLFALAVVVPLLTVYADVLGVMGGALVAFNELDISLTEFLTRFEEWVALRHFLFGIGKAPFFAIIIAIVGCYQGFQIRGNVDDVGRKTTIGVVQSIFLVIVFDALCSMAFSWWNV